MMTTLLILVFKNNTKSGPDPRLISHSFPTVTDPRLVAISLRQELQPKGCDSLHPSPSGHPLLHLLTNGKSFPSKMTQSASSSHRCLLILQEQMIYPPLQMCEISVIDCLVVLIPRSTDCGHLDHHPLVIPHEIRHEMTSPLCRE